VKVDGVAALGNMALRMPENCSAIAAAGGIPAIVNALNQHIELPRMQSKGCLAVRTTTTTTTTTSSSSSSRSTNNTKQLKLLNTPRRHSRDRQRA